jgi:hypothetical protein
MLEQSESLNAQQGIWLVIVEGCECPSFWSQDEAVRYAYDAEQRGGRLIGVQRDDGSQIFDRGRLERAWREIGLCPQQA